MNSRTEKITKIWGEALYEIGPYPRASQFMTEVGNVAEFLTGQRDPNDVELDKYVTSDTMGRLSDEKLNDLAPNYGSSIKRSFIRTLDLAA